mgnify:CR=1 FL=1
MKKSLWLVAGLALVLGACAEMDTKPAASANPELDALIASAEKEIAAAKKGSIWRDTEKFLEAAKKAQAEGKDDEAMKLAKKALKQAQLAQKQAQAETGKPYFPN